MLYFDQRYKYEYWKLKIMMLCMLNIYYLALFNYSQIKGDIFTVGIVFGLAEFLGILIGEPAANHFPDWIAMTFSTAGMMICCLILKIPHLG